MLGLAGELGQPFRRHLGVSGVQSGEVGHSAMQWLTVNQELLDILAKCWIQFQDT